MCIYIYIYIYIYIISTHSIYIHIDIQTGFGVHFVITYHPKLKKIHEKARTPIESG